MSRQPLLWKYAFPHASQSFTDQFSVVNFYDERNDDYNDDDADALYEYYDNNRYAPLTSPQYSDDEMPELYYYNSDDEEEVTTCTRRHSTFSSSFFDASTISRQLTCSSYHENGENDVNAQEKMLSTSSDDDDESLYSEALLDTLTADDTKDTTVAYDNIPELDQLINSLDQQEKRLVVHSSAKASAVEDLDRLIEEIKDIENWLCCDDDEDDDKRISHSTTEDDQDDYKQRPTSIRSEYWNILGDFEKMAADIASMVEQIRELQMPLVDTTITTTASTDTVLTFDRDRVKVYVIERPDGSLTGVCQNADEVESVLRYLAAREYHLYKEAHNKEEMEQKHPIYFTSQAPVKSEHVPQQDGLYFHFEYKGVLIHRMQSWEVRSETVRRGWRYQSAIERQVWPRGTYTVRPVDLTLVKA